MGLALIGIGFHYPVDAANSIIDRGPNSASVALVVLSLLIWLVPMRMVSWSFEDIILTFFSTEAGAVRRAFAICAFIAAILAGAFLTPFVLDRVLYDLGGVEPVARRWLFDWLVENL